MIFDLLEMNMTGGALAMMYYGHSLLVEVVVMSQVEHLLVGFPEVHFDPPC